MKEAIVKFGWEISVVLESGFPRIMWSYHFSDGSFGGLLFARPASRTFALRVSKNIGNEVGGRLVEYGHSMTFCVEDSAKLIDILTTIFGWGEPPHFSQVLQDILMVSSKLPADSYEEAKEIADGLTQKWEVMIAG